MTTTLRGRPLVAGHATGVLLVTDEPLSFWGGYDPETGAIIDRRHPLVGSRAAGTLLAVPATRGSSTTTAVLLESVRRGTAPAALLCRGADAFLALASIVAEELYGTTLPVIALEHDAYAQLPSGTRAIVSADGTVTIDADAG